VESELLKELLVLVLLPELAVPEAPVVPLLEVAAAGVAAAAAAGVLEGEPAALDAWLLATKLVSA
jgi:hypothetical protein